MIGLLRRRLRQAIEPIVTTRLQLVAITEGLLHAESQGIGELGEALQARVSADWPPRLWAAPVRAHIGAQLTAQPATRGYHRYMLLQGEPRPVLVGSVGAFPTLAGDVELGYSVVDSAQRRGVATEAAGGLIAWLFQQPAVHSVSAQAYETSPESIKVMQRCGMHFAGLGDEAGTVRYRRWR